MHTVIKKIACAMKKENRRFFVVKCLRCPSDAHTVVLVEAPHTFYILEPCVIMYL